MNKAKRYSILIIDDEPNNIITLSEMLEDDYTVYAEIDSAEAVETVENDMPDVVLLDVLMPGMDGYEVIAALKKSEKTRDIPVVFITGLDSIDAEEKGFALGAADYIPKPFHRAVVKLRVKNQINILERLRQQALMMKISQMFLSGAHTDALFSETLRIAGEFMGVAQVLLYEMDFNSGDIQCRSEWLDPELNLESRINESLNIDKRALSYITQLLESGQLCLHSNDPVTKEAMKPYRKNFHNYIIVPIFIKGKVCAVIDFADESDERIWSESEMSLAVLLANVFSNVFERDAMEDRCFISEHDLMKYKLTSEALDIALWDIETLESNPIKPDNKVIWSKEFRNMLGYDDENDFPNVFMSVFSKTHPEDNDHVFMSFNAHINDITGETPFDVEFRIKNKSGVYRYYRLFGETLRDAAGLPLRVAGACMDIDDRKQMINEINEATKMAQAASQAKSDFLANMSHEIRTPLNSIIGMTLIGKRADHIDGKVHALNKIGDASSHLLGIVNDILDMAKIEADKLELFPVEFNFEHMIEKVLNIIHFRADEKQLTVTVNIDKNMPRFIIGDDQRLAQAIANLMSNAVKFTYEGGAVHMNVSLIEKAEDHCELCVEVTDSGIGISAKQQEKLFAPFEQADSGVHREFGGTGLGLSITKRIVELMEGRIWVESELAKGAKFSFTAKVKIGSDKNSSTGVQGETEEDASVETESTHLFTGKRLLIVEDIEINREILILLLEDSGLIIDCAENGREAFDMVAEDPDKYDVVFMDLQMPQMDGLEATRHIRELPDPQYQRLPIIAMTANVFKEDIDICLAAGMNDHLGKPLDFDKVLEVLHKYLTKLNMNDGIIGSVFL